jgi:hypothetical protein
MSFAAILATAIAQARPLPLREPGCEHLAPKQCLNLAVEAMGGQDRLRNLKSLRLQTIGHTILMEESYRIGRTRSSPLMRRRGPHWTSRMDACLRT